MKVVILAGGKGTRISEESHLRPKPMIEIGEAPILWHIMKYYSQYGHNEFIICCGYKGDVIKEYFANYYLRHSDVTFDFSNGNNVNIRHNIAEPWKVTIVNTGLETMTGGRILRIRPYVGDEPFFMTYGDGLSNVDLNLLMDQHTNSGKIVTLSAIQPRGRFGVLKINDQGDSAIGFQEKAQEDKNWINAGFMVMEQGVFDYLENDSTILEFGPLEHLSREGNLGVYRHYGFWQCMDTQRDKNILEELWNSNNASWKIW